MKKREFNGGTLLYSDKRNAWLLTGGTSILDSWGRVFTTEELLTKIDYKIKDLEDLKVDVRETVERAKRLK